VIRRQKRTTYFGVLLVGLIFLAAAVGGLVYMYNFSAGANTVTLYNSQIDDIRLAEMINSGEIPPSTVALDLGDNEITDLSPLEALRNLKYLSLVNNRVADLSPLESLKVLKNLYLSGNPLTQDQIDGLRSVLPNCMIDY